MSDPVTVGVIGAGIMGRRMLSAILGQDTPHARLSGVWDPSPEAMARLTGEYSAVQHLPSPAAVIAASDCLYIASPPSSHIAYAQAALEAGKTFFCEKPLAVDLEASRNLVRVGGNKGAVNFPFASSLGVATLRQWLAEGAIGEPRAVRIEVGFAKWPRGWQEDAAAWLDRRAEGGFTREVVSHFMFLSRRLLGPLGELKASVEFPDETRSERGVDATLVAGVVPVHFSGAVGKTELDEHNSWTLEGDRGAIRLRDWAAADRRTPDGSFQPAPDALPIEEARPLVLRRQLEGVAKLARGEPHHLATLQEAFEVQEVVERILAS